MAGRHSAQRHQSFGDLSRAGRFARWKALLTGLQLTYLGSRFATELADVHGQGIARIGVGDAGGFGGAACLAGDRDDVCFATWLNADSFTDALLGPATTQLVRCGQRCGRRFENRRGRLHGRRDQPRIR